MNQPVNRIELDPRLNFVPEGARTAHLIGICGTAMGALAGMLVEKGLSVTGSDQNVYPPMSTFLAGLGVPVANGFAPSNLDHRPDLVVVGNVVTRLNPEIPRLKELGLPYVSLPQALKQFCLDGHRPLVVAGTHGKTTTSSIAAWLLNQAGLDPGFMIGGLVRNLGRNYRLGQGPWFVVEGDEYDTAFFDKQPKFVHYAPVIGILTSIEFDHADIYPDFPAVQAAFRRFVDLIPSDGLLVAWGDDPLVREMAARAVAPVLFYGQDPENHWRAEEITAQGRETVFRISGPDRPPSRVASPLPGRHNALNTLAVWAALTWIGLEPAALQAGLTTFLGVRRRQEVRGVVAGVTVIDDFAHHPTAVLETLTAIRQAYPGRLVAVFEPRTNTSRRKVFQEEYARVFDAADLILIRQAPDLAKVPENERFSSARLVGDLQTRGLAADYFPDTDQLLARLLSVSRPGDLVLIMSNGGFDGLHERLLEGLAAQTA